MSDHLRFGRIKSPTSNICGSMDTYLLETAEAGICGYCEKWQSELDYSDMCCKDNVELAPSDFNCRKLRRLRGVSNAQAINRGEIKISEVNKYEGVALVDGEGNIIWKHFGYV